MVELLTVTGFRVAGGWMGVIGAAAARDAMGATALGAPATLSGTFDLDTGTTTLDASAVLVGSAVEFTKTGLGSGAFAAGAERSAGGATGAEAGRGTVFADIARMGYAGSAVAAAPVAGGKTRVRPKNISVAPKT
ncbi:MAG: hypothetical protein U9N87_07340 [Planctomycetota bacterium]|nr:hypothetical protein [Planctomycetota bacterium]